MMEMLLCLAASSACSRDGILCLVVSLRSPGERLCTVGNGLRCKRERGAVITGRPPVSFHIPNWCLSLTLSFLHWPLHVLSSADRHRDPPCAHPWDTSTLLPTNGRIQAAPTPVGIQSCSAVVSHLLGRAWPQLPSSPGRLCSSEQTRDIPSQSSLLHDSAEESEQTPAWGITAPKGFVQASAPCPGVCQDRCSRGKVLEPQGRANASPQNAPIPDQPP